MKNILAVFILLALYSPVSVYAMDFRNLPIDKLEEYVRKGNPAAQNELGNRYWSGVRGARKKQQEAIELFEIAAEQGVVPAQLSLGDIYKKGLGVEKNLVKAIHWYRLAADQGNEYAKKALSKLESASDTRDQTRLAERGEVKERNNPGNFPFDVRDNRKDLNTVDRRNRPTAIQTDNYSKKTFNRPETYPHGQREKDQSVGKYDPWDNKNNRLLYLTKGLVITVDGADEEVDTETPFVINTVTGSILYPENCKDSVPYKKEDFTEKFEYPTFFDVQLRDNKLLFTIKSMFYPMEIKIKELKLKSWVEHIAIDNKKKPSNYLIKIKYNLKPADKLLLRGEDGVKMSIITGSERDFSYRVKEKGQKVSVVPYKTPSFR